MLSLQKKHNSMKHLSTLFTIILCTLPFQFALANESWHFGPTVGYENTTVKIKSGGDQLNYENLSGFNLGGLAEYRPLDWLGIESGIEFVMNGYWEKGFYQSKTNPSARGNAEIMTSLFYLMLPLYVEGFIPVSDDFSINIECGPEFHVGLDSKTSLTVRLAEGGKDYAESWYKGVFDESLDRFNCTIHLAGGVQYAGFRLMAGYNFGVYNMLKDGGKTFIDPDYKLDKKTDSFLLSGFVINLSYLF